MREDSANYLTTRQLARRWQVSEASIKRWADAGRLNPVRTPGGHRRFALSEVLRFQNEQGLDVRRKVRKGLGVAVVPEGRRKAFDEREAGEQFFEAIVRGQESGATAVLLASYMDGLPLVKILDVTVTEAMRRVGDLWHSGEASVADEHLATQTATRALETLRQCIRVEEMDGLRALACAVEDELHVLPILCVQLLLEEKGWSVLNLGASTPFYAMTDAIKRHHPQLTCISSTANMALSRNARDYDQFRAAAEKRGVKIALGGEGFRDEVIRQRFPASLHAGSFQDLIEFLRREKA